jgi:hypothetical protein
MGWILGVYVGGSMGRILAESQETLRRQDFGEVQALMGQGWKTPVPGPNQVVSLWRKH